MFKYLTHKNTYRYIDVLDKLVHAYNHSRHRSIKMRPVDVVPSRTYEVWMNLYGERVKVNKPKLKKNDTVRISKSKGTFEKSYESNWSDEIFTIKDILPFPQPLYRLEDLNNEPIDGYFYEHELQKVQVSPEKTYKIDKILDTKGKGSSLKLLVKWKGYSDAFNSWIPASELKAL